MELGLLPGGLPGSGKRRNHVHFVAGEPRAGQVISGMRGDCEIAIYLDLEAAVEAGVPFFISANEVALSPGVNGKAPAKLIKEIRDRLPCRRLGVSGRRRSARRARLGPCRTPPRRAASQASRGRSGHQGSS